MGVSFLVVKTVKEMTYHLLKLVKVFSQIANASVYSNASYYSRVIKVCKTFASP